MTQTIITKNSNNMDKLLKEKREDLLMKEDDIVSGVVIEKRPRQLYVDMGIFGTAIVYGAEHKGASDTIKKLEVGSEVFGKVVDLENNEGYIEISLKEADRQMGWKKVGEMHEKDEVLDVVIGGFNRGGLVANVSGVQAFMPVSHLGPDKYPRVGADQEKILEALREIVGQTLQVKIITANQKENKLIISERAALEENVKDLIAKYKIGDVIDGIVSGVVDFGAFIRLEDTPEVEGMVHLSELDHRLIDNPRSVLSVDEKVQAKIIDIKDNRISLSIKALKENPWDSVEDRFKEGHEVAGEISRFNPFGALVKLDDDFQGLIHVSEFGGADEMKKFLEVGQSLTFVIQAVKPDDKRIVLVLPGNEKLESTEEPKISEAVVEVGASEDLEGEPELSSQETGEENSEKPTEQASE